MAKLPGAEVSLGPEMKSTGEAMGVDRTFAAALYKAMLAAGLSLQPHCGVLVSLADRDKPVGIELVTELVRMGHPIYATAGTAAALQQAGLPVVQVAKRISEGSPNVLDIILDGTVRAVINTPGPNDRMVRDGFQIRRAAVERGIPCITSIDTARALIQATLAGGAAFSVLPLPEYRQRITAGVAVTEEEPVYGT